MSSSIMSPGRPSQKRRSKKDRAQNVRVVVRCRPQSAQEKRENTAEIVDCVMDRNEVVVHEPRKAPRTYTFDGVFGPAATQEDVYADTVRPLVDEVLRGFNCTVFAYGQTGTGKTHTMEGDFASDENAGMIPRAIRAIFDALRQVNEFSVKVSFLELYNEELTDLMDDDANKVLRMFEDAANNGIKVAGLDERIVNSADQVFEIVSKCLEKRRSSSTLLNDKSSRSHSIFTITIFSKVSNEIGDDVIRTGKLHLVDLAGSECIARSGVREKGAREAGNINKSLLTLGRVINSLVENHGHVPYRDSKLTRLLKESLGGTSKTVIVATVSPSGNACEETHSTLQYANAAKNIRNKPVVNENMTHKAYMKQLLGEINKLKRENEVLRTEKGVILPPEEFERMKAELKSNSELLSSFEATLQTKEAEYKEMQQLYETTAADLAETQELKRQVEQALEDTRAELQQTRAELEETRVRLAETEFIVERQQSTETQLAGQAKSLKFTVERVINDKNLLHEKIDRKLRVEAHNEDVKSSFKQDLTDRLSLLNENVQSYQAEQSNGYSDLTAKLSALADGNMQQLAALRTSVQGFGSKLEGEERGIREECARYSNAVSQNAEADKTAATEFQSRMQESLDCLSGHISGLVQTVTAAIEQQTRDIVAWQQTINDGIQRSISSNDQHAELMRQRLSDLSDRASALDQQQQQGFTSCQSDLQNMAQNHEQQSEEMTASLMSGIGNLLKQFMSDRNALVRDQANTACSQLQQQTESLSSSLQQMNSSVSETSSSVALWNSDEQAQHEQFRSACSNMCSTVKAQAASVAGSVDAAAVTSTQVVSAAAEQNSAWARTTMERRSADVEGAQQHVSALSSTLDEMTAAKQQFCAEQDAGNQQTGMFVNESVKSLDAAATEQHDQTDKFAQIRTAEIQAMIVRTRQVIDEDMKVDQPTGRTPIKKDVLYPTRFSRTKEHTALVQTFRRLRAGEITEAEAEADLVCFDEYDIEEEKEELTGNVNDDAEHFNGYSADQIAEQDDESSDKENNDSCTASRRHSQDIDTTTETADADVDVADDADDVDDTEEESAEKDVAAEVDDEMASAASEMTVASQDSLEPAADPAVKLARSSRQKLKRTLSSVSSASNSSRGSSVVPSPTSSSAGDDNKTLKPSKKGGRRRHAKQPSSDSQQSNTSSVDDDSNVSDSENSSSLSNNAADTTAAPLVAKRSGRQGKTTRLPTIRRATRRAARK